MNYFVYIIYSTSHDKYYKGSSANPLKRLDAHNNRKSRYTKHFCPWVLVFIQKMESKKEMLIRERKIKKYSKKQCTDLIKSHLNNLNSD